MKRDLVQMHELAEDPEVSREESLQTGFAMQTIPDWVAVSYPTASGTGNRSTVTEDYVGEFEVEPASNSGDNAHVGLSADGGGEAGTITSVTPGHRSRGDTQPIIFEISFSLEWVESNATVETAFQSENASGQYLRATHSSTGSEAQIEASDGTTTNSATAPTPAYYDRSSREHVPVSVIWDMYADEAWVVANGLSADPVDTSMLTTEDEFLVRFLEVTRDASGDGTVYVRNLQFNTWTYW